MKKIILFFCLVSGFSFGYEETIHVSAGCAVQVPYRVYYNNGTPEVAYPSIFWHVPNGSTSTSPLEGCSISYSGYKEVFVMSEQVRFNIEIDQPPGVVVAYIWEPPPPPQVDYDFSGQDIIIKDTKDYLITLQYQDANGDWIDHSAFFVKGKKNLTDPDFGVNFGTISAPEGITTWDVLQTELIDKSEDWFKKPDSSYWAGERLENSIAWTEPSFPNYITVEPTPSSSTVSISSGGTGSINPTPSQTISDITGQNNVTVQNSNEQEALNVAGGIALAKGDLGEAVSAGIKDAGADGESMKQNIKEGVSEGVSEAFGGDGETAPTETGIDTSTEGTVETDFDGVAAKREELSDLVENQDTSFISDLFFFEKPNIPETQTLFVGGWSFGQWTIPVMEFSFSGGWITMLRAVEEFALTVMTILVCARILKSALGGK